MIAPLPPDEAERLAALRSYDILDTPPEEAFERIVRLAATTLDMPMVLITLLDERRQWFKAGIGVGMSETPRELAFCGYTILADEVLHVPDARLDPRFASNALVTGNPNIRFYAGAPLISAEGQPLGTLCTLDTVPRELSTDQREALRVLARQVMAHLELRRTRLQLDDERLKLDGVLRMANSASEELYADHPNEIFVKQEQRLVRVATHDLQYVEALGDHVNLYTTRDRLTVHGTMKDLETKLPGRDFARVHLNYIVRLDRIVAIEADTALLDGVRSGTQVTTPVRVPIASSYKAALLSRLNMV
jgi:hypothetical protein